MIIITAVIVLEDDSGLVRVRVHRGWLTTPRDSIVTSCVRSGPRVFMMVMI